MEVSVGERVGGCCNCGQVLQGSFFTCKETLWLLAMLENVGTMVCKFSETVRLVMVYFLGQICTPIL